MSESITWLLRKLLRAYRLAISPYLPPSCRHDPTCSAYAQQALQHYGPRTALRLIAKRLARCHPWQPGGYDPLPSPAPKTTGKGTQHGKAG